MTEDKKPFCLYPWFHQSVQTDGTVYPCCKWPLSDGYKGKDYLNSDFVKDIRKKLLSNDLPKQCQGCAVTESLGRRSQRVVAEDYAKEIGYDYSQGVVPASYEVHPSNLCNIKCRTCKAYSSSKWNSQSYIVGDSPVGYLQSNWKLDAESVKHVKRIQFLGGESMLHQHEIIDCLKFIKHHGNLSQLSLSIVTNATVLVKDSLIELMGECKTVGFDISIDGYGKLNEYIRSDSKWEDCLQVLEQLKDIRDTNKEKYTISIFPVVSIMNINMMYELYMWWIQFMETSLYTNFAWCSGPKMYDPKNLPLSIKQQITNLYNSYPIKNKSKIKESILNHLNQDRDVDADKHINDFMIINTALDNKRGVRFEDVNPEMYNMLLTSMMGSPALG